MDEKENNTEQCGYRCGSLPGCAPLAIAYVPGQENALPRYEASKALTRGTLFPGLDLPLGNIINQAPADVPAAELMAIDFAAHDLALYLDTHPDDAEAFAVYKDLLKLSEEGTRRYIRRYGPLCHKDLTGANSFTWLESPWPWELKGTEEA